MDLNVECNEINGENVDIPKENDQVQKESVRVVQGCSNYKILLEEHVLMHILDHNANLEGQGNIKSRNYKVEWIFKYPWARTTNVLSQI